jgi:hypothetical protein
VLMATCAQHACMQACREQHGSCVRCADALHTIAINSTSALPRLCYICIEHCRLTSSHMFSRSVAVSLCSHWLCPVLCPPPPIT